MAEEDTAQLGEDVPELDTTDKEPENVPADSNPQIDTQDREPDEEDEEASE